MRQHDPAADRGEQATYRETAFVVRPDEAAELGSEAQRQAQQAQGSVRRKLEESPLAVGAAAVALGAAVGLVVPETRREHQLMGEARDSLIRKAQSVAEDTQHKVQNVAEEAKSAAQQEVKDQHLAGERPPRH